MHPPPFHPDHRLSDWPECYLEIRCGCGRLGCISVKLLMQRLGDYLFRDVLPRLRCETCGREGGPVFLVAGQTRLFCGGHAGSWAIEIAPDPDWRKMLY